MKYSTLTHNASRYIIAIALLLNTSLIFSQNIIYSPYTRFGLGDFVRNRNVILESMGGTGIGLQSNLLINTLNPASYTAFDSLSFLFDLGISNKILTQATNTDKSTYSNANIKYFTVGFPIAKRWRSSFGLVPFSTIGYNLTSSEQLNDTVTATHIYNGLGGLNQFYFGNAFKITKGLSLGFNVSYLFGSLDRKTNSSFSGITSSSEYRNTQRILMQDMYFNFGLQYIHSLSAEKSLTIGIIYDNKTPVTAKNTELTTKYLNYAGKLTIDTLTNSESPESTIEIPMQIGLGLAYQVKNKLSLLADFKFQDRSNVLFLGVNDSLKSAYSVSIGGEYTPQYNSPNKYFKRVVYRGGLYYYKSGLEIKETPINDFGISFGMGFPLRRSKTMLNLSLNAGQRGTLKNNLIKENYFVISVSLNLFDNWFYKRKFE